MPTRVPASTYRLQFNRSFTFQDASGLVPYLNALGVSDCYASSYLRAVEGSTHGYDVADPTLLNPELGTPVDYRAFVTALQAHRMGQLLDVVPNHMGIARSMNPWWLDVLENGPSSRYAPFFDIDWHPIKLELEDKVLLPILGEPYGAVLEDQQVQLCFEDGVFRLRCYDTRLPIAPASYLLILSQGRDGLERELPPGDPHLQELQSLITALRHLPSRNDRSQDAMAEGAREREIIKKRLARLVQESPRIRAFIEANVRLFNGVKGQPRSFDLLDALLDQQVYRLAFWRVASEEINYRRFFDINELAAIRMEHPGVFYEVHRLIFGLLREGSVTALRIDHVDGLYDPPEYLRHWQAWARAELPSACGDRPLFVVVEKILAPDEPLPGDWPVHGTTGYEFANIVNGLFVDGRNERVIDDIYARFIGHRISFEDLVYETKKLIMHVSMASEINVLGRQLNRFSERNRLFRDFTLNSLIHAIREIIACFPVYRTYVSARANEVSDRDRRYIQQAVAAAKRRNPAFSGLVFDFVRDLLLKRADYIPEEERDEHLRFVMKFQQTTSPITAKGIEDTALYIYNRLVSLNEVGGAPQTFGASLEQVHQWMCDRRHRWPLALSATTTHDTKRSEDVRARIDVLSEMPGAWKAVLSSWSRLNQRHRTDVDGQPAPDRNEEYLLYQTLVGLWPFGHITEGVLETLRDRLQAYMLKALKEAKLHSGWLNPSQTYEDAVTGFVAAILDRRRSDSFLRSFVRFHDRIAPIGICNSLAQLLIKIAAPGVPDFYQGTELWDFSLVDPDNRRPVDYRLRARLLGEILQAAASDRLGLVKELVGHGADGRIKLYVTAAGLCYRRDNLDLFTEGDYVPLDALGARRDHVIAFARTLGDRWLLAVAPRLAAGLGRAVPLGRGVWKDTEVVLPAVADGEYLNIFTGELVPARPANGSLRLLLGDVLSCLPVAMMTRRSG